MRETSRNRSRSFRSPFALGAGLALLLLTGVVNAATDDARNKAKRIYDRIAGVPPTEAQLEAIATIIDNEGEEAGALAATEAPEFYSVTLKNFVTPWTNRDQTVFAPLNDYTATVIGMVRDNRPFNTVLSEDILYTVTGSLPAPSVTSNAHYEQAEERGINLKDALVPTQQSAVYGIPSNATAGVLTTRAAAEAFFIDGTNRAMFRFTMINHLCRDMEALADTTLPADRIRQDVARSPGGDSRIFLNNCIGCHTGMDPMAQAFAYYDFDETQQRLVYTEGVVNPKYFINPDNFKQGYITPDDAWENRWRTGQNRILGWSPSLPGRGNGAKSLGEEIANSYAFAQCQVEKVFKAVCFRAPTSTDNAAITSFTASFRSGYNLRNVFAQTAAYCAGP